MIVINEGKQCKSKYTKKRSFTFDTLQNVLATVVLYKFISYITFSSLQEA